MGPTDNKKTAGSVREKAEGLEEVMPNNEDVLCGKSQRIYNHPGNQLLRKLVNASIDRYGEAKTKKEKSGLVQQVLEAIQASGGRFLRLSIDERSGKDQWFLLGARGAKEKVGHTFRDKLIQQRKERERIRPQQQQQQQEYQPRAAPAAAAATGGDPSLWLSSSFLQVPAMKLSSSLLAQRQFALSHAMDTKTPTVLYSPCVLQGYTSPAAGQLPSAPMRNDDNSTIVFDDDRHGKRISVNATGSVEKAAAATTTTTTTTTGRVKRVPLNEDYDGDDDDSDSKNGNLGCCYGDQTSHHSCTTSPPNPHDDQDTSCNSPVDKVLDEYNDITLEELADL